MAWLDLVRGERAKDRLASLVKEFAFRRYLPKALEGFVAVEEARERWTALTAFYRTHGHFLVTNGPYILGKWSEDSAVLQVFRDVSYPSDVKVVRYRVGGYS